MAVQCIDEDWLKHSGACSVWVHITVFTDQILWMGKNEEINLCLFLNNVHKIVKSVFLSVFYIHAKHVQALLCEFKKKYQ